MSAQSAASAKVPRAGFLPPARGLVQRPRLLDRLQSGTRGPITLLSAPAGSGKTVLVASWIRQGKPPGPVAWVSVERDERDATRFWGAVIEELAAAAARRTRLDVLVPAPEASPDELLARLLDWLSALDSPLVLVLDELSIETAEARRGLQQLLTRHHRRCE